MLKFYFKNHPEHKSTIKKIRNHIKAIEAEDAETVEDSEDKKSLKKKGKNKKEEEEEINNGSTEAICLLNKKSKRKVSEINGQEKKKKKDNKNCEESSEKEEYNFTFKKPAINESKIKIPNAPFKRINENLIGNLDQNFKDNSYDTFMIKSGNNYGKEANDKLKVVRGKDFKKEKTKFKNKSSAGSFAISTEVKSIKLDCDSD